MKPRNILFGVILIIFGICVGGIFTLTMYEGEKETKMMPEAKSRIELVRATVEQGVLESTYKAVGTVSSSDNEYIETLSITFRNQKDRKNFHCNCNIGDDINKDDELYSFKNKSYKMVFDGRVSNILIDDKHCEISLLNYEKLNIQVGIKLEMIKDISYGMETSLQVATGSKEDTFTGKVIAIGSEVIEGTVMVSVKSDKKLLPGTNVNVTFHMPQSKETKYILKDFLQQEGETYFVYIDCGTDLNEERRIKVGEVFTITEDGYDTEFIEILDGLDVGEKIVKEVLMD